MARKPADIPQPTGLPLDDLVPPWPGHLKESAQQVWLAGLGALSKAQAEGSKTFEALIQEGQALQRKTQAEAQERLAEMTERLGGVATELTQRATGQWDKLEGIFENRVSKALQQMGFPRASDLLALHERLQALEQQVQALQAAQASEAPSKPSTRTTPRSRRTAASGSRSRRQPPTQG